MIKEDKVYDATYTKEIRNIIENYIQNEEALVKQLHFKCGHSGTIGGFREDVWREMLKQIVPKKFVIEQSVFIIDSHGRVSNEVDLAIFDETYTPYIFKYGRLKFIPIEAVAVVIECKSASLNQKNLKVWVENIAALKTSRESYVRIAKGIIGGQASEEPSAQTATRPLRILCCLNEKIINQQLSDSENLFDFIIRAPHEDGRLKIEPDDSESNLQAWYHSLNHADPSQRKCIIDNEAIKEIKLSNYKVNFSCEENKDLLPVSLLTFNLQLNQLLMLINNPIWFPHKAYAEMFNKFGKGEGQ